MASINNPDVQLPLQTMQSLAENSMSLVENLLSLTEASKAAVGESMDSTLQHLYLQEPAATMLETSTEEATTRTAEMLQTVQALNKSLHCLDLLVEHVKKVRKAVDELDAQVERLTSRVHK